MGLGSGTSTSDKVVKETALRRLHLSWDGNKENVSHVASEKELL